MCIRIVENQAFSTKAIKSTFMNHFPADKSSTVCDYYITPTVYNTLSKYPTELKGVRTLI